MNKIIVLSSNVRNQYLVLIGISILVTIMTVILNLRSASIFQLFLGRINPLIAILSITIVGISLLTFILSRDWFTVYKGGDIKGRFFAVSLAVVFGLMIILVDLKAIFPADINSPFPDSLLFYPVIGYVVEILFHLLPFSFIVVLLTKLFKGLTFERAIWMCIPIVAVIEPVFQTLLGSSRSYPTWLTGYVFLHIYAINFVQLVIFKRYDFVSMFSFRLVYYTIWHIVWGYLRLNLLF